MSSEKNFFRRWLDGQVDWSAMLEQEKPAPKAENDVYKPRWDAESARQSMERGQIAYTVLAIVACIVFAAFMLLTVANLPGYGSADAMMAPPEKPPPGDRWPFSRMYTPNTRMMGMTNLHTVRMMGS